MLNGGRTEVSCGNGVQEGAHVGGALRSERLLELPLRFHPSLHPRLKTGFAGRGHPQLFAPAIAAAPLDDDQAVALQRQDIPSERRPIHDPIPGKNVDRHRS